MRCEIEPARAEDAPALAQLVSRALTVSWSEEALRQTLEQHICRALAAREGAQVCGFVLGRRVVDEVQITLFAVDPRWQGRGLGRRLLGDYLERSRDEGARMATLEVRSSNEAALSLYRDFGFAVEGRRPRYYANGEDALLLGAAL